MIWITFSLFFVAAIAPWVVSRFPARAGQLFALVPLAGFAYFISLLPISGNETITQTLTWAPSLGATLAFRLDGLSMTFAILITFIGAMVLLYSSAYMKGEAGQGRFFASLLAFMGAMLGLVISDSIISLFVFWELTSIFSYLLIGFHHEDPLNRKKALKALLVTGGGGLALLAGLLMMIVAGMQLGLTFADASKFSTLSQVDLRTSSLYTGALILVALGCFTKSAQFPFHFWLPAAMAGPTPVSSFLHSATMVKAGVFLLAKLHPMLGGTTLWIVMLTTVGAITMVIGGAMAVAQRDMKYVLAYSTIGVLGALTMLLGPGTELTVKAMVVFLVAHALYKATLFQVAGSVDHEAGTRDLLHLGGLRHVMPITAAAAVMAALSKSGFPGTLGFIGKELIYKAKLDLETLGVVLVLVALLANIFLTATALMVAWWPFFGKKKETPKHAHEAPWPMWIGPLLMGAAGVFVGLLPWAFEDAMGAAMASTIAGYEKELNLKLIPPLTTQVIIAFGLSVLTLAGGFLLFSKLHRWVDRLGVELNRASQFGPGRVYDLAYQGLLDGSKKLIGWVQHGRLSAYVATITGALVAAVAWWAFESMPSEGASESPAWLTTSYPHEWLLALLIAGGAIGAVLMHSRIAALASLGVSGFGIAAFFSFFSAIDLALTQLMVETLTVMVLAWVLWKLPDASKLAPRWIRASHAVLALAAGAMMTLLILAATAIHDPGWVWKAMSAMSVPEAKGRNIVNVILVDFRALDTLGEVLVVAAAGLGVLVLLGAMRRKSRRLRGGSR